MVTAFYRFVVLFLLVLILWLVCLISSQVLDRRGLEMVFLIFKVMTGIAVVSFVLLCLVLLALGRSGKRDLDDPPDL